MRHLSRYLGWLLAAALVVAPTLPGTAQSTVEPLSAFPQSLLAVRTKAGKVINFKIWTADSPRREQQGLMFVKHLDEHTGMLFLFPENKPVAMWMKNTYIPLDLLFMNPQGKIDFIAVNAQPLSLDNIGPATAEYAVLELNGGATERFGIRVGDTVLHKTFKTAH
jgi:uncharacterized protein